MAAWRAFSGAFREFPFHVGVVYSAPLQLGPANLFWSEPTRYHATMVGFPYDDLDAWRAVYPPEIFIQQLEKVLNCRDLLAHWLPRLRASRTRDRSLPAAEPERIRPEMRTCALRPIQRSLI